MTFKIGDKVLCHKRGLHPKDPSPPFVAEIKKIGIKSAIIRYRRTDSKIVIGDALLVELTDLEV